MQVVEFEGKDITYPGSWDEMTLKYLKPLAQLLFMGLSPADFKIKLIFKWLNLDKRLFNYNDRTYFISGIYRLSPILAISGIKKNKVKFFDKSDAWLLAETLNFLLTAEEQPDGQKKYRRNIQLLKQLIPVITAGKERLYGPGDRMINITAGEFAKAETRYQSYLNTGDEKYLNELIAVLYRPNKRFINLRKFFQHWDGENRVDYHDFHLARAKAIGKIDHVTRLCILLHFEGCRNYAVNQNPEIFEPDGSDEPENNTGWAGIFQAISDKPTEIEQIARLNFWTLLFDLKQKAIQAKKLESKYPENE
jgi:hypothetical protein